MIKFFRKIRQKLVMENKFSRYLLYAIGEIALVMIGILLALQVNNWNNLQNDKKLEIQILEDLKVEFAENKKDAERVLKGHISIVNAMRRLTDNITVANYNLLEADTLMSSFVTMPYYTPKPGASNNLINSGNLNILSNEALRNQLTLWSGVIDEVHDDEEDAIQYTRNSILPFLINNYPIINFESFFFKEWEQSIIKNLGLSSKIANETERKSVDLEALYGNPILQNHVSLNKILHINCAGECKPVVEATDAIAALIDSELKRLKDD